MKVDGKNIMVTGGGNGLGRELVLQYKLNSGVAMKMINKVMSTSEH